MSSWFGLSRAAMFRWAAVLLVCGIGLLIPKSALAGCGDYLAMPGHLNAGERRLWPEHSPDETPQRPCQGPHCRQAPAPTDPATPVRIERPLEQWAFIPNLNAVPLSLNDSLAVAPLFNTGAAHPLSIDRPPR